MAHVYSYNALVTAKLPRTKIPPALTPAEDCDLIKAWVAINTVLSLEDQNHFEQQFLEQSCAQAMLSIIHLNDKRNQSWIPGVASQLRTVSNHISSIDRLFAVTASVVNSKRDANLLEKLGHAIKNAPRLKEAVVVPKAVPLRKKHLLESQHNMSHLWKRACNLVSSELCIKLLADNSFRQLALPLNPIWIDNLAGLQAAKAVLELHKVVAIDTEWYSDSNGKPQVATLQVAVTSNGALHSYVIDLLGSNPAYRKNVVNFVKALFTENFLLLGFAVQHNDIPKLEIYVAESLFITQLLDLQTIAATTVNTSPGLQATLRRFIDVPLSKAEQCSDWARRPLLATQLAYAGLDAAVLLVLVTELRRAGY